MGQHMRGALMAMGAMLIAGCGPTAADNPGEGRTAAEAVISANAAKDRAMIARDAEALAAFYTDDYRVIDNRAEIHDKQNQVDFMTKSVELLSAKSDEVAVEMLAPNAALVKGRLTGRYRLDGKEADFVERYTGVWVKQGESWRVKHEHGSMEPAATLE